MYKIDRKRGGVQKSFSMTDPKYLHCILYDKNIKYWLKELKI